MSARAASQFVDTNILVYAHDVTAGRKHSLSRALIRELWASRKGCLSLQILQEFYVTVTRKTTAPLPTDTARQIVADLAYWRVHAPDIDDSLAAIDIQKDYVISFWDAMILRSAIRLGCNVLLSEDLQAGQVYHGVQVINPFAP